MGHIARNSVTVTIFNITGLLLVFLSNVIIAYKFGAGTDMDIYFASTTLPFFIMTIISVILSFTFIPIFTEYEKKDTHDKWSVVSSFINAAMILTALLCAAGMLFSRDIMFLIIPGFSPEKIERAAMLMRLLFPVIILNALNELLASVYYVHKRFVAPSLNKVLSPAVTICYVLLFGSYLNTESIILALLSAFFMQSVFLLIGFLKHRDFNYSLNLDLRHPEVIKMFGLVAPLIAATFITKTVPLIDRFFLSSLQAGSISHVTYAYRMTLRIIDAVASGLVVALFPVMAIHAASTEYDKLYSRMMEGAKMLFFLTIPFVAIFFLYGKPIIKIMFERGMFTSYDTQATFKAFSLYLFSLPAAMIGGMFYKGLYSLQKYKAAAGLSVLTIFFYAALCVLFLRFFGYLAIPLSHVIVFNLSTLIAGQAMRRYLAIKGSRGVVAELGKNTVSAVFPALCIWPLIGLVKHSPFLYIIVCALGLLLYFVLSVAVFHIQASRVVWGYVLKYRGFFAR